MWKRHIKLKCFRCFMKVVNVATAQRIYCVTTFSDVHGARQLRAWRESDIRGYPVAWLGCRLCCLLIIDETVRRESISLFSLF